VQAPVQGPEDDVEVFLPGLQPVQDAVEQDAVLVKAALQEAEVAAVQFLPELLALQVLQPPGPQVAPPVILDPAPDGLLPQVTTGFLALDPFVAVGLALTILKNACFGNRGAGLVGVGLHGEWYRERQCGRLIHSNNTAGVAPVQAL